MRKERTDWRGSGLEKQADHLVFLDESSVNIDLTRRYSDEIIVVATFFDASHNSLLKK